MKRPGYMGIKSWKDEALQIFRASAGQRDNFGDRICLFNILSPKYAHEVKVMNYR
jgi:hypothetical protein